MAKERDTEAKKRANMRASVSMRVRVRACACASACACARAQPNGDAARRGPAEDGSELRSHVCSVAKVEARGHAPGGEEEKKKII
jgi:hypothetical protein